MELGCIYLHMKLKEVLSHILLHILNCTTPNKLNKMARLKMLQSIDVGNKDW